MIQQILHRCAMPQINEILTALRAEITPLAQQIICPKDNTFARQLILLQQLNTLLTESRGWISVADELPDDDTTVLITNNLWDEPVWIGYLDGGCWHDIDGNDLLGINLHGDSDDSVAPPTHWTPLPEPPTSEEVPA